MLICQGGPALQAAALVKLRPVQATLCISALAPPLAALCTSIVPPLLRLAQRLFEYQQVKPYVVHTTFQYGGSAGKRHRLREAMLWVDPPEYYSGEWCAHQGRCHCFEHLNTPCIWGPPEYYSGEWGDRLHQEGFCALSSWIEWFSLSSCTLPAPQRAASSAWACTEHAQALPSRRLKCSDHNVLPRRGTLPQRGPAVSRQPGRLPGPRQGAQFITVRICVLSGSLAGDGVRVHGLPLALHCQRRDPSHPLPGTALNTRGSLLACPYGQFMMEGQRFATTWKEEDMIDFHLKVGRSLLFFPWKVAGLGGGCLEGMCGALHALVGQSHCLLHGHVLVMGGSGGKVWAARPQPVFQFGLLGLARQPNQRRWQP